MFGICKELTHGIDAVLIREIEKREGDCLLFSHVVSSRRQVLKIPNAAPCCFRCFWPSFSIWILFFTSTLTLGRYLFTHLELDTQPNANHLDVTLFLHRLSLGRFILLRRHRYERSLRYYRCTKAKASTAKTILTFFFISGCQKEVLRKLRMTVSNL